MMPPVSYHMLYFINQQLNKILVAHVRDRAINLASKRVFDSDLDSKKKQQQYGLEISKTAFKSHFWQR
jgi:hypothetical protein